jgi:hypothetical protein
MTWVFPGPVDNPIPVVKPKIGIAESDAGYRDAWVGTAKQELTFEARFVPSVTTNGVTGYLTVGGVLDALTFLSANPGRYFPDKDVGTYHTFYLISSDVSRDGKGAYYRIKMEIRDVNNTAFREY